MGRPSLILLIALAVVGSWMFFNEVPLNRVPWRGQPAELTATAADLRLGPRSRDRIRIATFNLDRFNAEKASRQDVVAAVARVLSQFEVIAIQEIKSAEHYLVPNLVDALNQLSRVPYDFVVGPRVGRGEIKEQFAFIYSLAAVEIDRHAVYSVNDPDDLLNREPLVGCFRVNNVPSDKAFTFTLVNVHTDADESDRENTLLRSIFTSVRNDGRFEDDVILLGDFQTSPSVLRERVSLPGMTLIVGEATRGAAMRDNLLLDAAATTEFTGRSGVFDFLRELNLDVGFAAEVSRHFPVWAEFAVAEGGTPGRVASRAGTAPQ